MIVAVASGKGGTGKTTVAVNLAAARENVQLLDCDVEEPNAHLFIEGKAAAEQDATVSIPQVNLDKCTFCERCQDVCAFGALAVLKPTNQSQGKVSVFGHLCHSCGACGYFCPTGAIDYRHKKIGTLERMAHHHLQLVKGELFVGELMSPPVIKQVKAHINPAGDTIIDSPPGTSCPMIAAVRNADFCLLVTEPTPFGLHDLIMAVDVLRQIHLPLGVVINRCDLSYKPLWDFLEQENIPILLEIPFQREIAALCSRGKLLVEEIPSYRLEFEKLWQRMAQLTESTKNHKTAGQGQ